jgi:hypothetical protein
MTKERLRKPAKGLFPPRGHPPDLVAFGKLFAQLPEMPDLLSYRRSLPAGLDEQEVRAQVLARGREAGLAGEEFIVGQTGFERPSR